MKFKIGDRVRIVCADSIADGREGVVVGRPINSVSIGSASGKMIPKGVRYPVSPDGIGEILFIPPSGLRPLINPDETAWLAFKSLHLKPDPSLILAKEPAKEEV